MKPAISWLICSLLLFGCKDKGTGAEEKQYKQEKESLYSAEKQNPMRFLKLQSDFHRNIIGQTVVKVTVDNSATVCTYKNVRVKMLFFDRDKTLFENHEEVID